MTEDDRRLAAEFDEFIATSYRSVADFLQEAERQTGWKGTKATVAKIRHGRQKVPDPLRRWIIIKESFGAVYVEEDENGSKLLRLLRLAMESGDYDALIHSSTVLIACCHAGCLKDEGPEFLPRLHAWRAVGHRKKGFITDTIKDYKEAAEISRVSAPRLAPRYDISVIVWESEHIDKTFRKRKVGKTFWEQRLREMVGQLTKIATKYPKDESLRLQSLLRNTSRLGDRMLFDHWLGHARKHEDFGSTPEKRDLFLRRWMAEKNQKRGDDDFRTARSYQSFTDLF